MGQQYSAKQVASMLGYTPARILLICKEYHLNRVGNQYVLGFDEIEFIKQKVGHKPTGRPKKNKE